jgi:hypothetical protein
MERETGIEPATPFGFAQGRLSAWKAEGPISCLGVYAQTMSTPKPVVLVI